MDNKLKNAIYIIILVAVCAVLALTVMMRSTAQPLLPPPPTPVPTPTPTPIPTPTPVPTPTPEPEYFTISFIGDNTLSSGDGGERYNAILENDMTRPFANTVKYFENDDLSIANFECIACDEWLYSDMMFHFRAPVSNLQALTNGGIDFVTTANNHIMDYGQEGLDKTLAALDDAGIAYGTDGKTAIYETESGLKVGIFCGYQHRSASEGAQAISELKAQGAEYIICAIHWGDEGKYRATDEQKNLGHALIDAGADLVYGSHPHVLEPIEEYGDGLILYSMGNWSFGGNAHPRDMDTAIVQVTVKRDIDGSISTDAHEVIPCRLSSTTEYNDYCPTPYEEDSEEYKRVISKLDGSFDGADLVVDYSFMFAETGE